MPPFLTDPNFYFVKEELAMSVTNEMVEPLSDSEIQNHQTNEEADRKLRL